MKAILVHEPTRDTLRVLGLSVRLDTQEDAERFLARLIGCMSRRQRVLCDLIIAEIDADPEGS